MLAFVAGPILYAQQKPTSVSDLKTEQNETTQAEKGTQSTQAKSLNLSDSKAVNRKSSSKTTTVKKVRNAKSLKDTMEE